MTSDRDNICADCHRPLATAALHDECPAVGCPTCDASCFRTFEKDVCSMTVEGWKARALAAEAALETDAWKARALAAEARVAHPMDDKHRCPSCKRMTRITTAGCDHCDCDDK